MFVVWLSLVKFEIGLFLGNRWFFFWELFGCGVRFLVIWNGVERFCVFGRWLLVFVEDFRCVVDIG